MKLVGATLLILLAASGAAFSADRVKPANPEPSPERFANGATFDWSGFRIGVNGGLAWSNLGVVAGEGGLGGIHGGYDWRLGDHAVAGIEGSAAIADIKVSPGNRLNSVVDLRARLGMSFDRVLVYGTAGGAFGRTNTGLNGAGWTAGAGLDYAATKRTIAGMEYVRYRFDNFANTGNTLDVDLIKGRITYKF